MCTTSVMPADSRLCPAPFAPRRFSVCCAKRSAGNVFADSCMPGEIQYGWEHATLRCAARTSSIELPAAWNVPCVFHTATR